MTILIDKATLFLICILLYISFYYDIITSVFNMQNIYMIIILLICIILSAIMSYLEKEHFIIVLFLFYIVCCIFNPSFLIYMSPVCYDILKYKKKWLITLLLFPIIIHYHFDILMIYFLSILLLFVSYLLISRTLILTTIKQKYNEFRDQTRETSIQFAEKNKELLEKQDYEINLATLTERNRIARDIHDNVGHLLASSILQTGALIAISHDEKTKENLFVLKDTLTNAMNTIRSSVHDLHEQSFDLYTEIKKLVDTFTFCSIELNYEIENLNQKTIAYCFIAVIKEALSNIIKHSNATNVHIILNEHPALYQLIIHDNGRIESDIINKTPETGIGLESIKERVNALHGIVNFSTRNGFRIFISISKNANKT